MPRSSLGAQLLHLLLPSTELSIFVWSFAVSSPHATSPCWVQWPPFARRRDVFLDTEQAPITARMFSRVMFAWAALPATLFTDWRGTGGEGREESAKSKITRNARTRCAHYAVHLSDSVRYHMLDRSYVPVLVSINTFSAN